MYLKGSCFTLIYLDNNKINVIILKYSITGKWFNIPLTAMANCLMYSMKLIKKPHHFDYMRERKLMVYNLSELNTFIKDAIEWLYPIKSKC